ncbi:uncharacterized protein KY384_001949 [Bacidia gigantensis]|uniref:uncharacterized protein n=1 Tax=Bacidia gigantensis TaxID=2732470 RepID=UPI001D0465C4|nr:uncharacterized protein KY384_001949 [Bacidia gigantensis]KAG8533166.1 hypothetical protein KY384_001949 [Bacidia gigantensis]
MAEPQPPTVTEGMDDAALPPASAEDRKAAAAMDALESSRAVDDQENQKPANAAQADAISQAISRLELVDKAGKVSTEDPNEQRRKKREEEQKEKERKAKIKVNAEDVAFFVEECDMTKMKATDFLRQYEGDLEKAVRGYIRMWA